MRLKRTVAVAGTHGKTTTTSMVAALLDAGGVDPTVINGGIIESYGSNARLGDSEWMVVEADESDGSFLRLDGTIAVVTNIDPEHLDHYGSFDAVKEAFVEFIENVPFYGAAVLCIDHPEVQKVIARVRDRRVITYGFSAQADWRAEDVRAAIEGGNLFDAVHTDRDGNRRQIADIALPMPGRHNVQNALAAIAVAVELGCDDDTIRAGFARFGGVRRRFTRVGEVAGATVIDDYAHHPVEIRAVLVRRPRAARGRVIAVAQPHRFTRLRDLMGEFQGCFNDADMVFVAPVYPAGERRSRASTPPRWSRASATAATARRRRSRARPSSPSGSPSLLTAGRHGRLPRRRRHHQVGRRPRRRHRLAAGARGMTGQIGSYQGPADAPGSDSDYGFDGWVPTNVRGKLTERRPARQAGLVQERRPGRLAVRAGRPRRSRRVPSNLDEGTPVMALGLGSNLIVRDGGVPGVVVRLGKPFATVEVKRDCILECGGGASGILVASTARDAGIAGLEFLRGIPGTVGGFVRMNGGAYGREVADILVDCDVLLGDGDVHHRARGGPRIFVPPLEPARRRDRRRGAVPRHARQARGDRRRDGPHRPRARGNAAAAQQDRRLDLQEPARRQGLAAGRRGRLPRAQAWAARKSARSTPTS